MLQPAVHVIVFFDHLHDVGQSTGETVTLGGFLTAEGRTRHDFDIDTALGTAGVLDTHLEDAGILRNKKSGRIDKGRIGDI